MADAVATKLISAMRRPIRPGVAKLRDFVQGKASVRKLLAEVKTVDSLVASGHDPLHAAYTCCQNYLSVFGELASRLPEFAGYRDIVGEAEETYVPGWPPISPVSGSFFTCWALLDQPIGESGETICSVAVAVGREFGLPADFAGAMEAMGNSAMGIYEHLGWGGGLLGLRDILDGTVHRCIVPSNHKGKTGELWYARLLPPLGGVCGHSIAFTSPYVLLNATKADWLAFFERQERHLPQRLSADEQVSNRKALLKRGPDANYWNEFVFLAYHDAKDTAIALMGIPDMPQSLPHGRLARKLAT